MSCYSMFASKVKCHVPVLKIRQQNKWNMWCLSLLLVKKFPSSLWLFFKMYISVISSHHVSVWNLGPVSMIYRNLFLSKQTFFTICFCFTKFQTYHLEFDNIGIFVMPSILNKISLMILLTHLFLKKVLRGNFTFIIIVFQHW